MLRTVCLHVFFGCVMLLHSGLALTKHCQDGWSKVLVNFDSQSNIEEACLRIYDDPLSWRNSAMKCRREMSHLIMLDQIIRNATNNYRVNFNLTFWSGMHVVDSKLKWDGTPPTLLESFGTTYVRHWYWESGHPNTDGGCGLVVPDNRNTFEGTHMVSLMDCQQEHPYICMNSGFTFDFTNASYCPVGYVTIPKWNKCYKLFKENATFEDAENRCSEDGGNIAGFSTVFEEQLLSSALKFFTSHDNSDSCCSFGVWMLRNNTQSSVNNSCFIYVSDNNRLKQTLGRCNISTYYMCEKNVSTTNSPVLIGIVSNHENNTALSSEQPYASLPITCYLDRRLNDFEVLIFTQNNKKIPSNTYIWDKSRVAVHINVPVIEGYDGSEENIPLIVGLSALSSTGSYRCEIYKSYTIDDDVTRKISVRYRESSMIFYKAMVELFTPVLEPDYSAFNFYSAVLDNVVQWVEGQLQLMLSAVSRNVQTLQLLSGVTMTLDYRDVIFRNGSVLSFSIYGLPSNTFWYSLDKEQQFRREIQSTWEVELKQRSVAESKTRKKRQNSNVAFTLGSFEIQSTVGCSGNYNHITTGYSLTFQVVHVGQTSFSEQLCITDRQPLASADCEYDAMNGANLVNIKINPLCVFEDSDGSSVTSTLKSLSEIEMKPDNADEILRDAANLTSMENNLSDIDVIYTAVILTKLADNVGNVSEKAMEDVIYITDNMLEVSNKILENAQERGSAANRILESIERIGKNVFLSTRSFRLVTQNIAMTAVDIEDSNDPVLGIRLLSSQTGDSGISSESVTSITEPSDFDTEQTDVGLLLPPSVYENGQTTRLFMHIHDSAKLFKARKDNQRYQANSRVVAAQLSTGEGVITRLGNHSVTTVFKLLKPQKYSICGFWNYTLNNNSGGWATDGCVLNRTEKDRIICKCDHLTNFAILIDFERESLSPEHHLYLSIITIVGLSLSVFGLGLSILSFVIFRQIRKGKARQTFFNLALALFCADIIFLIGINQTGDYTGCIIVSALLHYFILTAFMWMLVEGILQYLRFVKVLGTYIPRLLLKTILPAWGLPLIPVFLILVINKDLYYGGNGYCWLSLTAFYYAFALPVGLIILINFIVFIIILKNLVGRPKGLESNQTDSKIAWMNFRAAVSVFFLLGISWVFGYVAISDARLVFQYIFSILNAFQGAYLFVLFTLRDAQIRQYWRQLVCGKQQTMKIIAGSSHDGNGSHGNTQLGSVTSDCESMGDLYSEDTLRRMRSGTYTKF